MSAIRSSGKITASGDRKWKDGVWDIEPFEKAGVKLVFFPPRRPDYQTAHDEDELYFIDRGSREIEIEIDGERSAMRCLSRPVFLTGLNVSQ